eukprot:TRINITY_DN12052_c0_g1_i1.p1 TRINITY_DN12052_c0_g1~~TRINITY_DN12052_c0_g1_i1.p1  ORF type:complete len:279 (+),score=-13.08 TRINITY_DN12052_c0_g1_i1:40-876(+)
MNNYTHAQLEQAGWGNIGIACGYGLLLFFAFYRRCTFLICNSKLELCSQIFLCLAIITRCAEHIVAGLVLFYTQFFRCSILAYLSSVSSSFESCVYFLVLAQWFEAYQSLKRSGPASGDKYFLSVLFAINSIWIVLVLSDVTLNCSVSIYTPWMGQFSPGLLPIIIEILSLVYNLLLLIGFIYLARKFYETFDSFPVVYTSILQVFMKKSWVTLALGLLLILRGSIQICVLFEPLVSNYYHFKYYYIHIASDVVFGMLPLMLVMFIFRQKEKKTLEIN